MLLRSDEIWRPTVTVIGSLERVVITMWRWSALLARTLPFASKSHSLTTQYMQCRGAKGNNGSADSNSHSSNPTAKKLKFSNFPLNGPLVLALECSSVYVLGIWSIILKSKILKNN